MSAELFFILNLLILGFSAITSLFLVSKEKRNLLLIIIVPVIVFCCINAYNNVHSLLGLSRPDYLPTKRVMVLQVVIEKKEFIHFWYVDEELKEPQPRAIKIPYTEENKKIAEGLAEGIKSGQGAFAEFKGKMRNDSSGGTSYGVTIKQFNISSTFPNKEQRSN